MNTEESWTSSVTTNSKMGQGPHKRGNAKRGKGCKLKYEACENNECVAVLFIFRPSHAAFLKRKAGDHHHFLFLFHIAHRACPDTRCFFHIANLQHVIAVINHIFLLKNVISLSSIHPAECNTGVSLHLSCQNAPFAFPLFASKHAPTLERHHLAH